MKNFLMRTEGGLLVNGDVASVLMANDCNPGVLRTNTTLRNDEWKAIDDAVIDVARKRLRGVQDLYARNLVTRLPNGLGSTVMEWEKQSDMNAAEISMDARTRGTEDRVTFDLAYLPLPITHKDFRIGIRQLNSSRNKGIPLDTTQIQVSARKVAESLESLLFMGTGGITYGGGTLYGYTNHASRNTTTITAWDGSGKTGAQIVEDVRDLKAASIAAQHYGPWVLYIPTDYETVIDDDFKAASDVTIRERILKIEGVEDVKVADYLTGDNVVLVEMSAETVQWVEGMPLSNIEWTSQGGMEFHFKIMTIGVPRINVDANGNCGITHGSTA